MDKTIVVRVDSIKSHPKYKKVIRRSAKFHAHDEQNQGRPAIPSASSSTGPLYEDEALAVAEILEVAK